MGQDGAMVDIEILGGSIFMKMDSIFGEHAQSTYAKFQDFFTPPPPSPLVRRAYYINDVIFMEWCTQKQNPPSPLTCNVLFTPSLAS